MSEFKGAPGRGDEKARRYRGNKMAREESSGHFKVPGPFGLPPGPSLGYLELSDHLRMSSVILVDDIKNYSDYSILLHRQQLWCIVKICFQLMQPLHWLFCVEGTTIRLTSRYR